MQTITRGADYLTYLSDLFLTPSDLLTVKFLYFRLCIRFTHTQHLLRLSDTFFSPFYARGILMKRFRDETVQTVTESFGVTLGDRNLYLLLVRWKPGRHLLTSGLFTNETLTEKQWSTLKILQH